MIMRGIMQTRIIELLDIKYPIFQGGMAWVTDGDLAGAVSKAGGLAGSSVVEMRLKEVVKANIDKIKSLTDRCRRQYHAVYRGRYLIQFGDRKRV